MVGSSGKTHTRERRNNQGACAISQEVDGHHERGEMALVDPNSTRHSGTPGANIEDARGLVELISISLLELGAT